MTVDLHTIHLAAGAKEISAAWLFLSCEEKKRASRFLFPHHTRRFVMSHAGLRHILAEYNRCQPENIRILLSPSGKPFLDGSRDIRAIRFSMSHSEEIAVVAVCRGSDIGVDIEHEHAGRPFLKLAERYFTPGESRYLASLNEPERCTAFYRMWTLKESWLKATGMGLTGLTAIETIPDQAGMFRISIGSICGCSTLDGGRYQHRHFTPAAGFTGCYMRLYSSQMVSTM